MTGHRRTLLASSALLAVLSWTHSAAAQTRTFNVPAEDAVKAIPEFARQAGIQIVAPGDALRGVRTPAINGSLELHAALNTLLAGTGIEIASDDGQTIILRAHLKNAEAAPVEGAASIETVTVTGSLLAGAAPISPVITLDRNAIETSGYANTAEFMRTLPQNFGGGINPTTLGTLGESTNNISSASTLNLRGLGAESTLTLVDGHRLASDGFVGGVVDVSAIPLAAVERVEVLTDGASATYGSDAVGGVVNFVLRNDYDGAETSAQVGTSTQGGGTQYQASQLFGKDWGSGGFLVDYDYSRQNFLFGSHRSFSAETPEPFSLIPEEDHSSVFSKIHQDIGEGVTLFAEGLYTFRTGSDIETIPGYFSYYNRYRSLIYGVDFGADWQINDDWHANVTGTVSNDHSNASTYINMGGPFAGGIDYNNGMYAVEALVNGKLLDLPTGTVSVALGGGYREETFHDSSSPDHFDRDVAYVFGELRVPLVTESADRVGLERLELSLAGRYEHYSDVGSSTNPKVGLLYTPIGGLSLRTTWGTSFRAPGLYIEDGPRQLYAYPSIYYAGTPANTQILLVAGSNPNLVPEKAETWTAGADINPDFLPDLKLSVTAFGIGYRDRIITPVVNRGLAFVTPADAPFVSYAPSAAQQAALFANTDRFTDFTGTGYDPSNVYGVVYNNYQNVSSENASGFDLTGSYHIAADVGDFDVFGNGSWLRFAERATATASTQILSGTIFNPPVFKARAGVTWSTGDWTVSAIVNHISGETDVSSGEPVHIPVWTTADMQLSYSTTDWSGYMQGIRLALSVHNLFDTDPPALSSGGFQAPYFSSGYDSTNTSPLGRFISFSMTKDW
jgi:outer membrane receptor protein involved in Fe transport